MNTKAPFAVSMTAVRLTANAGLVPTTILDAHLLPGAELRHRIREETSYLGHSPRRD